MRRASSIFPRSSRLRKMLRAGGHVPVHTVRSEEHTSELQSQSNLVCRLLLEKKKENDVSQLGKPADDAHGPPPFPRSVVNRWEPADSARRHSDFNASRPPSRAGYPPARECVP